MRSITQSLDSLFEKWRTYLGALGAHFVRDGLIGDEADWVVARPRILFLLKQPHDRNSVLKAAGYDLTALFRRPNDFDQIKKTVGNRMREWASDIREVFGTPAIVSEQALLQSAVMNLLKLPGGPTTDTRQLREAIRGQARFQSEQIRILDPQIIVCGGTFKFLSAALGAFVPVGSTKSLFRKDGRLWVNHLHPSAWVGMKARHSDVMRELESLRHEV